LRTTVTPSALLKGRFTWLTIFLLVVLLSVSAVTDRTLRDIFTGIAFSVMVLFAIASVGRRLRIVTAILAAPVFLGHWALLLSDSPLLRTFGFALTTTFLAFLTIVVLMAVVRSPTVTADTIVGALCAYFLMGVTWGTAYALVALYSPDSFAVSPTLVAASQWATPTSPITPLLQYYSFITLSTVGFGDLSPLSGAARLLSALEGVAGQLYLAVLIARLVGLHAALRRQ
jgi:Ion channel